MQIRRPAIAYPDARADQDHVKQMGGAAALCGHALSVKLCRFIRSLFSSFAYYMKSLLVGYPSCIYFFDSWDN